MHFRIRLNVSNTDEDSNDYINASKVEAPLDHKTYILTQGPLEHTVGDFWTMVWQQQVSAIGKKLILPLKFFSKSIISGTFIELKVSK